MEDVPLEVLHGIEIKFGRGRIEGLGPAVMAVVPEWKLPSLLERSGIRKRKPNVLGGYAVHYVYNVGREDEDWGETFYGPSEIEFELADMEFVEVRGYERFKLAEQFFPELT